MSQEVEDEKEQLLGGSRFPGVVVSDDDSAKQARVEHVSGGQVKRSGPGTVKQRPNLLNSVARTGELGHII